MLCWWPLPRSTGDGSCRRSPEDDGLEDSNLSQDLMANAPHENESALSYWSRALGTHSARSYPEEFALVGGVPRRDARKHP